MITVNGVDLTTLGFRPRAREVPRTGGEQTTVVAIPGGVPVRTGGTTQPGRLTVAGIMSVESTGDRDADHQTLLEQVDAVAAAVRGQCVIRFSDVLDREWIGWLQPGSGVALLDPKWISRGGTVSLDFVLPDPRARAQTETVLAGSGALVLGTAPSSLRVEVATAGAATVRVRAGGAGGTILRELVWAGAAGALVIDAETGNVSLDGANAIGGVAAGYAFPIADPGEGADYVEVPAGATARYRRRWA
jgi:hypothetical protein